MYTLYNEHPNDSNQRRYERTILIIKYDFVTTFAFARLSLADLVLCGGHGLHLLSLANKNNTSQMRRDRKNCPARDWSTTMEAASGSSATIVRLDRRCRLGCA